MYHTVVMTCGISLFTGNNLFSNKTGNRTAGILTTSLQTTRITEEMTKEMEQYFEQAKTYMYEIEKNPHAVSAEYSMIHTLIKNKKMCREHDDCTNCNKNLRGYHLRTHAAVYF
ncbi:hypothetical protein RRV45_10750 [Bacillus sp. DTU_2020_1000418_1_SI_GHA_SEK_038]|uniref:hypothetical protein n=1 Tax=Bacillus sp. DTU_2020_1000418_1_SI_GHA_SEK_038 TaxID=3077585 RepID=UPI0028EF6C95|nr:hypothetical protein [Bacillus sp. DTU_2020_1000418_1_SI_GHA_SEK_038]WNS77433.1 hypothetical protein RRV45_10750 [Bacillus sp. DTU_2020_1000418_1_SI_GHA_SEK_038]